MHPCEGSAVNRQLDFWVGEWDVYAPQGHQVGTSSVQRILGGCVIFEGQPTHRCSDCSATYGERHSPVPEDPAQE